VTERFVEQELAMAFFVPARLRGGIFFHQRAAES
jgi:hypothetical protein